MNVKSPEVLWVSSFDIGSLNFAFYIEEINIEELSKIEIIPQKERYNLNGTPTTKFAEVLKKVYINGKKILLANSNITQGSDKTKYFDLELCHNMNDLLDKYSEYWDRTSIFIIEQQMSFKKKYNTKALKLAQNCASYFIFRYGRFKQIIEFPAYHKTHVLGCEKILSKTKKGTVKYTNISDYQRKKWAVEEAYSVLTLREDFETLLYIDSVSKKNDLADVICQLQAWKCLNVNLLIEDL